MSDVALMSSATIADLGLPLGEPLHSKGRLCDATACAHCSRCGLGPQLTMYFQSWTGGGGTELPRMAGLCPRCFFGSAS